MNAVGSVHGAPLADRLRRLVTAGVFDLPQPGQGSTADRLVRLADLAAEDLALARLAEAHLDGVTILREANREPQPGILYGVWASEAPHATLKLGWHDNAGLLHGRKAFCTGAGLVDRALVTARHGAGVTLVDIETSNPAVSACHDDWVTPAFVATMTATVDIDRLAIRPDDVVGDRGWYLERIGFWYGALAPAACWAGGAIGLARHCLGLADGGRGDDHLHAHLGVLDAAGWELETLLRSAGDAIDASPNDAPLATRHAYRVRTVIERTVTLVIDHAVRAYGPRLLAFDPWASQRVCELQLYVRQHHDTRDHAALGRLTLA